LILAVMIMSIGKNTFSILSYPKLSKFSAL
jgi:hypothetical protein